MNRKYMVLFIAIFTLGMFTVGGTYAYWTWASGTNKNVVFNTVSGVENFVVYDAGLSHFVGDFQPAANYCGGISNTISFKKTSAEVNLSATINMDVNAIEANMNASSDVYWVVHSGDSSSCNGVLSNALNYGTFNGKNNGDVIELLSDIVVTTTEQKFTIWIWINEDGTGLNKLSGETIDTNIWTQFDMVDNGE